ncbi:MAG: LCP family protein [Mogibacterium sp.]|nr:LCP family protein [Mogibacterium sp.]
MKRKTKNANTTTEELNQSKHERKSGNRIFPSKNLYKVLMIAMGLVGIGFMLIMMSVNIFPNDLTFVLIAIMMALIIVTSLLFGREKKGWRIAGIAVWLIFVILFSSVTYYLKSTYAMFEKINQGDLDASGVPAKNVSVTEESFNIYITGIDQWAYEEGLDLERSDANMLLSVNPVTKKVLLTSIPRDSYVKLHTSQAMDKLTHSGIYGVEETLTTVEDWLGVDINYYVKLNFTAVSDLIVAMDGIRVYSPVAFESSLKGYKYKKGWNTLSGRKALYFARERKAFEGQDAIRVENQQRVVEAVIKKLTSSTTLLTKYGDIMDVTGKNLTTNMSSDEMLELVKMQITELSEWDIESQKIEGEYGEDYVASLTQSQKFSVYRPSEDSVKKAVNNIDDVLSITEEEREEAERNRSKSFVVNLVKSTVNTVKDTV